MEAIQREIWNGSIPVEISLVSSDISSLEQPPNYYAMLPRLSYFPLHLKEIIAHFEHFAPPFQIENVWISEKGVPLRWQIPIGVIYDLVQAELPWKLTFHTRGFPAEDIIPSKSLRSSFINALKESAFLRLGSSGQVFKAPETELAILWNSLPQGKYEEFIRVFSQIFDSNHYFVKKLPLRFLSRDIKGWIQYTLEIQENTQITFEQTLRNIFKEEFLQKNKFYLHGVEIPQEAEVEQLTKYASFADGFLYITIQNIN